ncbi:hypothetical protein GCM10022393_36400 [Aquimarina addita]|uniref:Thiopeptide-type bacteriocin biosynthesis domain-containing protein n=1 Tax=Aquimarina addita TaxID=870485 RepID=A0ABP6UTW5_9FLAO
MDTPETKRIFITGEEWLYYKIYCGNRTSDLILSDTILPLVEKLIQDGYIDSWFFIRYNDPDFHLRIRFHIKNNQHIGPVIHQIKASLLPYIDADIVYKIQTDTYIRELERYGARNITNSETLFYKESMMILEALDLIEDPTLYFLFVLKAIDTLLEDFEFTDAQKLQLTTMNQKAFKKEFQVDKKLVKQLNKKYEGLKDELSDFLSVNRQNSAYEPIYKIVLTKSSAHKEEVKRVQEYLSKHPGEIQADHLISSYIHMFVNRAFRSRQRFYELVCYDFLSRYYRTQMYIGSK